MHNIKVLRYYLKIDTKFLNLHFVSIKVLYYKNIFLTIFVRHIHIPQPIFPIFFLQIRKEETTLTLPFIPEPLGAPPATSERWKRIVIIGLIFSLCISTLVENVERRESRKYNVVSS